MLSQPIVTVSLIEGVWGGVSQSSMLSSNNTLESLLLILHGMSPRTAAEAEAPRGPTNTEETNLHKGAHLEGVCHSPHT